MRCSRSVQNFKGMYIQVLSVGRHGGSHIRETDTQQRSCCILDWSIPDSSLGSQLFLYLTEKESEWNEKQSDFGRCRLDGIGFRLKRGQTKKGKKRRRRWKGERERSLQDIVIDPSIWAQAVLLCNVFLVFFIECDTWLICWGRRVNVLRQLHVSSHPSEPLSSKRSRKELEEKAILTRKDLLFDRWWRTRTDSRSLSLWGFRLWFGPRDYAPDFLLHLFCEDLWKFQHLQCPETEK